MYILYGYSMGIMNIVNLMESYCCGGNVIICLLKSVYR